MSPLNVPNLAPGKELRFGVETPDGRRSTQYRVWTSKSTDDVYLASRDLGGWLKVSLHESGSWQIGHTGEAVRAGLIADGANRHFHIWNRPPDVTPGLTVAARVLIPNSQLRPGPSTTSAAKTVYVTPPAERGQAVAFDVLLVAAGFERAHIDRAMPVGTLRQTGGGVAHVIARDVDLGVAAEEMFANEIAEVKAEWLATEGPVPAGLVPRFAVWGIDDDLQTIKIVELAIDL